MMTNRSYFYASPRGFASEVTIYATRRPKAMAVALDRAYGASVNADYGRISYRSALSERSWARPKRWSLYGDTTSVTEAIALAEEAGDELIARYVAPDDPEVSDLAEAVEGVVAAETALAEAVAVRDATIRAARAAGRTLAEIAEATGLTEGRIRQLTR